MSEDGLKERRREPALRRLMDRLSTIKLHAHLMRLRVRRGAVDPQSVDEHLNRIDREVEVAAQLVRDELGTT